MSNHPEAQFLHQRDSGLHFSPEVEQVAVYLRANKKQIPNDPERKIAAHLGFLADKDYANDGIITGDPESIARQVERTIIDVNLDTANAYAKFQSKIAREQGITITPDTTPDEAKLEKVRILQADQRKQLTEWVKYLASDDGGYPDWFKRYAFDSITKLTAFDEEAGKFRRRGEGSFALFPELDRESLALVRDGLKKHINHKPLGQYNDAFVAAIKSGNFARMYGEANKYGFAITPELKEVTTGSWKKYDQSQDPAAAMSLSGDVARYRTGWCTAGEETARTQLSHGDFYVWYTADPHGENTVPRIAIRMEQGRVREVRGVNPSQHLEGVLTDVAMSKLAGLPGGKEYLRKAADMKRLTVLEKQLTEDPHAELSKTDITFLYELDHSIQGFGYSRDPRIDEIKALRGDQDHPTLKELAVERIREHFDSSYKAYQIITEQLGFRGLPLEGVKTMYKEKLKKWEKDGVLDYVAERIISHGEVFTPVMTPNVLARAEQIKEIAQEFGKEQPNEAYVFGQLYDMYSPEELSGALADDDVKISLIPSKYDDSLYGSIEKQRNILADKQATQPKLKLRVPSVLEALCYWLTLRAGGDKLADNSAYDKTYIRHFDLEPKRLGDGFRYVPVSFMSGAGQAYLSSARAGNGRAAVVAVG